MPGARPNRAAGHHHALDPGGNPFWMVVGSRVYEAFRIEQHEVGAQALSDAPPIRETYAVGRAAGQTSHRFLGRYELLFEGVSPERAGGRAVQSGMGPVPEDAVRAHEL